MTQLPMVAHSADALVAREDFEEERRWRIQHGHDLARVTAERDEARAERDSAQSKLKDAPHSPECIGVTEDWVFPCDCWKYEPTA